MLKGYVSYIGAAGLFFIAVYKFVIGDNAGAVQALAEATALAGLRRAVN